MRLPIVSLTIALLWRESMLLRKFVVAHPYWGIDPGFAFGLLARVGVIVFLFFLAGFHISRWRPVRKFTELKPKLVALLGMGLSYLLLFFPRASPNHGFDLAAAIFLLIGNWLSLVAVTSLGRSLSIMPEARRLVTNGLYAKIRHPLYLGEFIALIGVFLQFRSALSVVILFLVLTFQIRRMAFEEIILAQAFPDYARYRQQSWRLLPGVY